MLEAVFAAAGRRPAVFGTILCRFGSHRFPQRHTTAAAPALQRMFGDVATRGGRSVAMEVSSHALAQRRTDGTRFRAAVFTNLTRDHLDFHRTMPAYLAAKARLFASLPAGRDGGVAVLNLDSPAGRRLARLIAARVIGYTTTGGSPAGGLSATRLRVSIRGTRFDIREGGHRIPIRLRLLGSYNVANALAAAGVARGLGIGWGTIRGGLEGLAHVPGRFEPVRLPRARFTCVVDYAHTPDALSRVITAARRLQPRRVLVVFGCGGNRDRGKRPVMGELATRLADRVWLTSDNPRFEEPQAILHDIVAGVRQPGRHTVEPDRRRAIRVALAAAGPGDVLIIAGKGHEREQVIGSRRIPFADAQVASRTWRHLHGPGAARA